MAFRIALSGLDAASTGPSSVSSLMKSPNWLESSEPTGISSDIGSCEMRMMRLVRVEPFPAQPRVLQRRDTVSAGDAPEAVAHTTRPGAERAHARSENLAAAEGGHVE